MRRLFVVVLFVLFPSLALAQGKWEKINEEEGIKVFRKEIKGSPLVAFRGDCIIDAPIRVVFGVIVDNKHRTEWVDRLEKSRVLQRFSPFDFIVYQHFGLPVIMSDRDYVYRATGTQNAKGQVIVTMSSCKHKDAPETVGVRARLVNSRYVLTPVGKKEMKTRIEVEILTDPKGWIPSWLVNSIQKSWPFKTLSGIRRQVKKDYAVAYNLPPKKTKKATKVAEK